MLHIAVTVLAGFSLAIWLYLVFARGGFWLVRRFNVDVFTYPVPKRWPMVIAVVPARNEAENIAASLESLLSQDYPGNFSIVVVDDHSEDSTASIAQAVAQRASAESRVRIHSASSLEPGWTGKLWALQQGISVIKHSAPEFFWFTDADIIHEPTTLRGLISHAQSNNIDLSSRMVLLRAESFVERALMPAFVYFFLQLYPPRWIANPHRRTAGAAGGSIVVRRDILEKAGGLETIRNEVIDDCSLADAVKKSGGRVWLGLTRSSRSIRRYSKLREVRDMIARVAFTQLHYSTLILFSALVGLFITYLAPIMLLFIPAQTPRVFALIAWFLMSMTFLQLVRFYGLSPLWAPLLPLAALYYGWASLLSSWNYRLGRGGLWKGRAQAPRQA